MNSGPGICWHLFLSIYPPVCVVSLSRCELCSFSVIFCLSTTAVLSCYCYCYCLTLTSFVRLVLWPVCYQFCHCLRCFLTDDCIADKSSSLIIRKFDYKYKGMILREYVLVYCILITRQHIQHSDRLRLAVVAVLPHLNSLSFLCYTSFLKNESTRLIFLCVKAWRIQNTSYE